MRYRIHGVLTLFSAALMALAACGSDSDAFEDDGGRIGVMADPACDGRNWRDPSADVVCPTAPGCGCATGQACCVVFDAEQSAITSSSCSELTACADVAFTCDGPEDCQDGQECCAQELGTACVDAGTCIGSDTFVLCRTDEDCGIFTCTPAQPGTYFEDALGFCD
ncbi:MAG: hypothetical protein RIF41_12430 [Polyangiaceae bacterium]